MCSHFCLEFAQWIDRRIDLPTESLLGGLKFDYNVRVFWFSDNQQINIAPGAFLTPG